VFDDPRMTEWPYVQAVAAHANIKVVTHMITPEEAWGLIEPVMVAQGEPLLGQDTIAHFRAFQLAHDHGCVVALEGQGADELFAGLPLYEGVMFQEWLRGGAWRTFVKEAGLRARDQRRSLLSSLLTYAVTAPARRWMLMRRRYDWLDPDAAVPDAPALPTLAPEASADPSHLNRYLFNLVRGTNLPSVLQMQDRNAMAHGVENRPPFLDHRVVEWAFRLPSWQKVSAGRRKRVLWNAGHGLLPALVLARRDKKAIVSRNDWLPLRTAHRDAVAEMAESPLLRDAPGIRGDRMTRFVHDYLRGKHDDDSAVWRLYTGWRWLDHFHVS
jgi:asparagine synthase (glutamine-hydrolysing)